MIFSFFSFNTFSWAVIVLLGIFSPVYQVPGFNLLFLIFTLIPSGNMRVFALFSRLYFLPISTIFDKYTKFKDQLFFYVFTHSPSYVGRVLHLSTFPRPVQTVKSNISEWPTLKKYSRYNDFFKKVFAVQSIRGFFISENVIAF